jgi:hypothetical protein
VYRLAADTLSAELAPGTDGKIVLPACGGRLLP